MELSFDPGQFGRFRRDSSSFSSWFTFSQMNLVETGRGSSKDQISEFLILNNPLLLI